MKAHDTKTQADTGAADDFNCGWSLTNLLSQLSLHGTSVAAPDHGSVLLSEHRNGTLTLHSEVFLVADPSRERSSA